MSIVPASLSRVPELMLMRTSLLRLNRTNVDLFNVQTQLSTGYRINRPSDDIVRTAAISILDDRLERSDQRLRNLDHAGLALDVLDSALGEASDLVLEAKSIASNQSNIGASAEERSLQSEVVDSLIQSLANIANRKSIAGYAFGGSSAGRQPIVEHMGGYRYVGEGGGLFTDNGLGSTVPITIGGANPIGELSARHSGNVDLDPALTGDTRLSDLNGARAMGVTLGVVEFSFEDGPHVEVDLTEASTVADVADALEAALKQHEVDTGQQILGPDGVSWQGGSFTFDIVNGPAGLPQPTLQFFDIAQGVTALDLGLTIPGGSVINGSSPPGPDVNARVTWRTPVGAMEGLSGALGSIRLTNMGQSQIIDLSGAETLGDVRNAIENSGLGVRVEINADATGIDVFNEVAGGREQAMSISEVGPSSQTAAALGIRTFSAATSIADFNDGEGVQIVTGSTDPETGAPDPSGDVDFIITIGDGTEIPVNLRPQDIVSVQTVIDRINAEAANAGVSVPATFQATVSALSNGIQLRQNGNLPNPISVTPDNNSPAPYQLGLMDATSSGNGASLTSSDRAKVRIDNLFTHLIDLRDSLKEDSTIGIDFAAQRIEASVDRVAQTRALVGGFANRVQSEQRRQEDLSVLEQKTRSDLRDLDYAEAAVRFSLLQTQLQAAMQAIQVSQSATLLDFLAL
jgi:flagellin-like hook-associated protein FlgL